MNKPHAGQQSDDHERAAAEAAWTPPPQTEQPLSPYAVIDDLPNIYRRRVDRTVVIINTLLETELEDLASKHMATIVLPASSPQDRKILEDAMQRFVDAGWQIHELGLRYFDDRDDTGKNYGFRFSLPGKF